MSDEKRKSQWPLVIVLCLIAIFGIAYFAIPPYLAEVTDLNLKVAITNEKISKTQQKISDLKYLQTQFEANQPLIELLNIAMPQDPQMPQTIISINSIAKDSGVDITSIQPKSKSASSSNQITLSINGYYEGLKVFLNKLEKNLRPINVTELSYNKSTSQTTGNQITASLTLDIYQPNSGGSSGTSQTTASPSE